MTEPQECPKLDQMRCLIQAGRTVREAARTVYGRVATYYEKTTEEQRGTVYCKPQQIEGFRVIRFATPASRANELAALAKAEGKDLSRLLNQLVIDRLTLHKQTQTQHPNVLEHEKKPTITG